MIQYDGWRFRFSRAVEGEAQEVRFFRTKTEAGAFDQCLQWVVLPLVVLYTQPSIIGIHGGTSRVGDQAWAFIGESGAGKSTTALELMRRGMPLVADDLALVDVDDGIVLPGAPSVRLWQADDDVAEAVESRVVADRTTKRWFRLRDECAVDEPLPLGGIVHLSPTDDESRHASFTRLSGVEALTTVLGQTFDLSDPTPQWMERRFRNARRLIDRIGVWRYHYVRSASGEPTHVQPLIDWLQAQERP